MKRGAPNNRQVSASFLEVAELWGFLKPKICFGFLMLTAVLKIWKEPDLMYWCGSQRIRRTGFITGFQMDGSIL
jgi:hypothetical protein